MLSRSSTFATLGQCDGYGFLIAFFFDDGWLVRSDLSFSPSSTTVLILVAITDSAVPCLSGTIFLLSMESTGYYFRCLSSQYAPIALEQHHYKIQRR